MKVSEWLKQATAALDTVGIGTARLDALVLLEDALGQDRAHLLAHPETELSKKQLLKLNEQVARRSEHFPLAYIRGKTEFYGRMFKLNTDVLEPRPESETMVDLLKKLELPKNPVIADIGTGSGAIAITAKLELPSAEIIATDIDKNCLKLSRVNAKDHQVAMTFYEGDLLEPFTSTPTVLLCNLPYVPDSYQINQAALQEPRIAIFGGTDGLALYQKLFRQTKDLKRASQYILTESLPFQHQQLTTIAQQFGYQQIKEDDFIQLFQRAT